MPTNTAAKPRPRPKVAPLRSRDGNLANHYLSHCKLCPCAVFKTQPHMWLNKPVGWSHTECAQQAGLS